MSDRDLISEGRALLAAATPPPWWVGPSGDIFAGDGSGESSMVAENPASVDARLVAWAVSNLPALLDALEAAQRPPLGYVVGTQTSDGWSFASFYGGPREDRAEAEQELAAANEEDGTGVYWQLLEVREVQP